MAPEQCRGSADIDEKADVYSLGVILYEALAGRPPFVAETTTEVMAMHMYQPPPPLTNTGVTAPAVLLDLIMRMLSKERGARPSMAIIAASLTEPESDPAVSMSRLGQTKSSQPEQYYHAEDLPGADGSPVDPEEEEGTMSLMASPGSAGVRLDTPQIPPVSSGPITASRGISGGSSTDSGLVARSVPELQRVAPAKPMGVLVTGLLTLVFVLAGSLVWSLTHPPVPDAQTMPAPSLSAPPPATPDTQPRTDAAPQVTPAAKTSEAERSPAAEQPPPDSAPKPSVKASTKTSKRQRNKSL